MLDGVALPLRWLAAGLRRAGAGHGGNPKPAPMPPGAAGCAAELRPELGRGRAELPRPAGPLPPALARASAAGWPVPSSPLLWAIAAAVSAGPESPAPLSVSAAAGVAAVVASGADALIGCCGLIASMSACWIAGMLAESAAITLLVWLAPACGPAVASPAATGWPASNKWMIRSAPSIQAGCCLACQAV